MAIWQYKLKVIPREPVMTMYGSLPFTLENSRDTSHWWKGTKINITALANGIDQRVERASYSSPGLLQWKGRGNEKDNDCAISLAGDGSINEFIFRTDLRQRENLAVFLNGLLDLCRHYGFVVINAKGLVMEPDRIEILDDIKTSDAFSFLSDPSAFLDRINEENNNK